MTKTKKAAERTQPGAQAPFQPVKFTSSWREEALARVCELDALIGALEDRGRLQPDATRLLAGARTELTHAQQAAERRGIVGVFTGAAVQRVHAHLDAAEVLVLRGAPLEYVHGQLAALVVYVRGHLPPSDPRCRWADQMLEAEEGSVRRSVAAVAQKSGRVRRITGSRAASGRPPAPERATAPASWHLSPIDRERLVTAVQGAMAEARNEQMRLRSFRNLLLNSAAGLLALAIGVCVFGAVVPDKLPVCFQPVQAAPAATLQQTAPAATPPQQNQRIVCPTHELPLPDPSKLDEAIRKTADPWDISLIAFLGLIAAAVSAATALRKVRGTSTPYSLPVALAFLKLPLGGLTAVLGLILMRANFVPGLSALDDSAQIIGWAVVFGYAQQAFTQVVDRKAQNLLEDVGSAEQRGRPSAPPAETATARSVATES